MTVVLDPLNAKELKGTRENIEVKQKSPCDHDFTYGEIAGEILCKKCHAGFFIRGAEHLKDGHLYRGSKRMF